MKFQRENTKVALTQKMKDDVVSDIKAKNEEKRAALEKVKEQKTLIIQAEKNFAANNTAIIQRELSYGPIQYQLDMLWHDMDRGVIPIDKTDANTWYSHIKTAKESTPLSNNWQFNYNKSYHEMKVAISNTNNSSV